MIRIGIYGGTFSPVHNGHLAAARAFMEQMWLDVLYVIPAGQPPHKETSDDIPAMDRLRMCELAFAGMDGVFVSDMEIRRAGPSYTVDTLRELYSSDNRLFLLIGSDRLMTLEKWKDADDLFRYCYPAYVRRDNDEAVSEEIIKKQTIFQQKYGKIVRKIVMDPINISSTEIRNAIREQRDISDMVPEAVADYIREKKLYQ